MVESETLFWYRNILYRSFSLYLLKIIIDKYFRRAGRCTALIGLLRAFHFVLDEGKEILGSKMIPPFRYRQLVLAHQSFWEHA